MCIRKMTKVLCRLLEISERTVTMLATDTNFIYYIESIYNEAPLPPFINKM